MCDDTSPNPCALDDKSRKGRAANGLWVAARGCTIVDVHVKAMRWVVQALSLMLALGCATPASAQAFENYTTRVWQTQDGLPQQTVQAVTQAQDGFLWIGTTGGLLRFDGSHFVPFERANTPAFKENSVFSLMTGKDGTLWIGTEGGGLIRMRDGQFRQFGSAEGCPMASSAPSSKIAMERSGSARTTGCFNWRTAAWSA